VGLIGACGGGHGDLTGSASIATRFTETPSLADLAAGASMPRKVDLRR
jgi:hypothetical protein